MTMEAQREQRMEKDSLQDTNPWDLIATGYDTHVTPSHAWLAQQALDRVGLRAGQRLLDVAAGSGAVALPAARRGAEVLAIDLSAGMVERLQARARSEGLAVEARVMDGHHLELDDQTFDVAVSQFGLMLFPDFRRGLSEMVRVTRPGGHVVVNAFGNPQHVEFLQAFLSAVKEVDPSFAGLPRDPPPLPFQVADPRKLEQELSEAGLSNIRIEAVTEYLAFRSGEEMYGWVMNSNPIPRQLTAGFDADQREALQVILGRKVQERADASGTARFASPVHIGIGTR